MFLNVLLSYNNEYSTHNFFSCTFYQIFIILQINVEKSMSELKGCDNLIKKLRRVAINEVHSHVTGFCDSHYAGDLNRRRSLTSYSFRHGDSAISWLTTL